MTQVYTLVHYANVEEHDNSFEILGTFLNWDQAVREAIQKAISYHSDEETEIRVNVDSVLQSIRVFLPQIIQKSQEDQARLRETSGQAMAVPTGYKPLRNLLREQVTATLSQAVTGLTADILEYGTRRLMLLYPTNAIFDIGDDEDVRFAVIQNRLLQ